MPVKKRLHQWAMTLGKNPKLALMKMVQGGIVFLFGVLILMVANNVLVSSLSQEIIALLGLIIAASGLVWTIIGYLSMSLFRIYYIIRQKD